MIYFKKYSSILLLLLLIFFKIQDSVFVKKIENISYDLHQSLFLEETDFNEVLIIDIDEKSISELGQFPWRRDIWGKLISKLQNLGVSVITFDVFFSEEDKQNPKNILKEYSLIDSDSILDSDDYFLKSINLSKVVLPIVGDTSTVNRNNNSEPKASLINKGADFKSFIYSYGNKITSIEKLNEVAKGIGSISFLDSEDGILRSLPLMLKIDNNIWPTLGLETLRVRDGHQTYIIKSSNAGIEEVKTRKFKIKTDKNSIVFLKYKKYTQDNYIPVVDILNDRVTPALIKNKIALIGSSAQGIFDFTKIPTGEIVPGVEIHARLIENIINNDFIIKNFTTKIIENILLIISLVLTLIIPKIIKPRQSIYFLGILIFSLTSLSFTIYQFNYFIDILYTLTSSSIMFLLVIYFKYLNENEIAIENDKKQLLLKKEREIAGEVQKKLFPAPFEDSTLIYARNLPARDVSGDYYDYIRVNDNEIYFTLADVSGKGIKAGILMANASSVFRSLAKLEKPVSTISRYVNNQVSDSSYQGMFITAVIGKINLKKQEIEFINHGHEPIMVFDKSYNFEYIKSSLPPLGIMKFDDDSFFQTSIKNIKDKTLLIYTDGVTEGYLKNDQELGADGFENLIKENKFTKSKDIIDKVCEALDNRSKLRDDITCIGINI